MQVRTQPFIHLHTHLSAAKEIAVKRAEVFTRISPTAFVRLVDSVAPRTEDESILASETAAGLSPRLVIVDPSDTGSADVVRRRFLVVDARKTEDFDRVHLRESLSFPLLRLRQDRMPYELIATRHASDRIVVCVDWDGEPGAEAVELVTKLVQTGWANAVLLSGGRGLGVSHFIGASSVLLCDAGLRSLVSVRPELFEGSASEEVVASARAEVEAAALLLPGAGAASTIRRGSVRPDGSFGSFRVRAGGSLRGGGGSVISGIGSSRGGGTPLTQLSSVAEEGFSGSYGGPVDTDRGPGTAGIASPPHARAYSISSRMTSGAASIGGAPMKLLAGSRATGAGLPGQSFSHSPRF